MEKIDIPEINIDRSNGELNSTPKRRTITEGYGADDYNKNTGSILDVPKTNIKEDVNDKEGRSILKSASCTLLDQKEDVSDFFITLPEDFLQGAYKTMPAKKKEKKVKFESPKLVKAKFDNEHDGNFDNKYDHNAKFDYESDGFTKYDDKHEDNAKFDKDFNKFDNEHDDYAKFDKKVDEEYEDYMEMDVGRMRSKSLSVSNRDRKRFYNPRRHRKRKTDNSYVDQVRINSVNYGETEISLYPTFHRNRSNTLPAILFSPNLLKFSAVQSSFETEELNPVKVDIRTSCFDDNSNDVNEDESGEDYMEMDTDKDEDKKVKKKTGEEIVEFSDYMNL